MSTNGGGASVRVLLTPEEVTERLHELAGTFQEFERLEDEHADRRQAMKREKEAILRRLSDLAEAVRTGAEYRPLPDGLFERDGRFERDRLP
jgi:hypothetical protein